MSTVISVENLGKKYTISHQQRGDTSSLREVITNGISSFGKKIISPLRRCSGQAFTPFDYAQGTALPRDPAVEDFWALKDVSFEVKQGDRIGIIGRNGAGKSTLLKVLSRITEPTTGRIKIKGRVASLLEVGTGFHPELTGRENIYLNGAILGMGRQEISRKFDEIVAFAEIEKFLDTPVKRYSSGMYVRLAFAVAAHLEPEILIVDEVLAVGDAAFQKKCLGKMEEVGREGRTVLFVSHNMQAILVLCSRVLLLEGGIFRADGRSTEVVEQYLKNDCPVEKFQSIDILLLNLPVDPVIRFDKISLFQNGKPLGLIVESGKKIEVCLAYTVFEHTSGLRVYLDLCNEHDTLIFRTFHDEVGNGIPVMEAGSYVSTAVIPANILGPLTYQLRIRSGIFNVRSCTPESGIRIPLKVVLTGSYNSAYLSDAFRGQLALAIDWNTARSDSDALQTF